MSLHDAQMGLLRIVGHMKSVDQIQELRQVICNYYAQKVDDEMDALWKSGEWSGQKIDELANAHLRTPYNYAQ